MLSRIGLPVLGFLVLAVALLWTFQRQLIFFPDSSPVPAASALLPGGLDVHLRTADGLTLGAWFAPPLGESLEMAVLVAPGNGGNRSGRVLLAEGLRSAGLAVLLMDYRGYGGNPGNPTEQGLALDADAAVAALRELGYPPERTIFFGESLGGGVVAALQERHEPAGVVLRSPFTELADVAAKQFPGLPVRWLLRDEFPVARPLARSAVPAVVIYGDSDTVVPAALSARVAAEAGNLFAEVVLPGADHNDRIMLGSEVVAPVAELARSVS